eukprot:4247293-Prymnesium_polylepis.2
MSSPSTTSPPPSSRQNATGSSAARSDDLAAAGSVWATAMSAEQSGTLTVDVNARDCLMLGLHASRMWV